MNGRRSILQEENNIKRPLLWITGAFVLGEVIAYWFYKMAKQTEVTDPSKLLLRWLVILGFALLWLGVKVVKGRFMILMLGGCVLGGFLRMSVELIPLSVETLLADGKKAEVTASGNVKTISIKNGSCNLVLENVLMRTENKEYRLPAVRTSIAEEQWEKALGQETGDCEILPGMGVEVVGKAELFKGARNPGEFDYAFYYKAQKIQCGIKIRMIQVTNATIPPVNRMVSAVSSFVSEALEALCNEDDRGIYEAVLLGQKTDLPEDIRQLYQKNGIAHLLAVSGLHVSLIGMSLYAFLRRVGLGYGKAGLLAGILVVFYGFLTGFGPSVFRAVFMILCSFFAAHLGKTYDLLSAMALSLGFLAFDSPYLLFTSGLQLSFGAVTAIGIASERDKEWKLFINLFIQLFTYPIILYHFFEFPLYALFLNMIVIPLMAYVVGAGLAGVFLYGLSGLFFAAGVSGFGVVFMAAKGAVGTGHYILAFYNFLCEAAERLPFYSVTTGRPELWKIMVYYGSLFLVLYWNCRSRKRWRAGFLSVGSLLVLFLMFHPVSGLEVDFLDVGQGDGIYLQTKKCRILMDAGSSQLKNLGGQRLLPFLKSKGVSSLDYVFVSHGDLDHISGIKFLLEEKGVKIKNMVFSCRSREDESCSELARLTKEQGGVVWYMEGGQVIKSGNLSITSIYPFANSDKKELENKIETDKNNQSLVLLVEYGAFSLLLTGDVESQGEEVILAFSEEKLPNPLTVLKAAHHGSNSSTGVELLERLNPGITVLSYGAGNSYGHPAGEVVERLKVLGTDLWHTAKSGAVMIKTDGKQCTIQGFIKNRKEESEEESKTGGQGKAE